MTASSRPVVLVTGAAKRLGRTMALELAAHGFDVAVHYRGSADAAQATVGELRALGAQAERSRPTCPTSPRAARWCRRSRRTSSGSTRS